MATFNFYVFILDNHTWYLDLVLFTTLVDFTNDFYIEYIFTFVCYKKVQDVFIPFSFNVFWILDEYYDDAFLYFVKIHYFVLNEYSWILIFFQDVDFFLISYFFFVSNGYK